jgi:hypothetical protein
MIECGFCGATLVRRSWHSGLAYNRIIWHGVAATKKGKKYCPYCKGIPEEAIENAFVKSYQLICSDQQEIVSEFLHKVENVLNEDSSLKRLKKIEKEIVDTHRKKEKLLDLRLDNNIDKDVFDNKNAELTNLMKQLKERQNQLLEVNENQGTTKTRINEFRKVLNSGHILENFDRVIFESIVEKIIIGGYNEEGIKDPLKITFVYKTGIYSECNGKDFKPKRKNAAAIHSGKELCSYGSDKDNKLCSYARHDTCGDGGSDV